MKNRKFYPWLVVALLWVVALLNYMDRQMLSTMQAEMKVDIVELQQAEAFGALMAVFLWVYGIVSPFAGIVADRISRKKLVVGSLFVWSLVTYLMGYASSFNQLYMLRALMGISEALYIPSALSLIADWHEGKSRSLAIGVHMTGLYVGQAIGGFGATVAAAFSWHTTFHWFGILGIAYSVVLLLLLHDKEKENVNMAAAQNVAAAQAKPAKGGLFQGLSYCWRQIYRNRYRRASLHLRWLPGYGRSRGGRAQEWSYPNRWHWYRHGHGCSSVPTCQKAHLRRVHQSMKIRQW